MKSMGLALLVALLSAQGVQNTINIDNQPKSESYGMVENSRVSGTILGVNLATLSITDGKSESQLAYEILIVEDSISGDTLRLASLCVGQYSEGDRLEDYYKSGLGDHTRDFSKILLKINPNVSSYVIGNEKTSVDGFLSWGAF